MDCAPCKIFGTIFKVDQRELLQMDQRTMTMQKALHSKDDVDRLYVSRKKGGKDLPALKTALTHRYSDSRTTLKSMK